MSKIENKHVKLLYVRFLNIFGHKFSSLFDESMTVDIWYMDWEDGLDGIDVERLRASLDYCRKNLEWPPSIKQFRDICLGQHDWPRIPELIQNAVRRDFSHPLTKIVYDKVGSWAMTHDSEKDLRKKFDEAYQIACEELSKKEKPKLALVEIETEAVLQLDAPVPSKAAEPVDPEVENVVKMERKPDRVSLKEYMARQEAMKPKVDPESKVEEKQEQWDKNKYCVHSKNYNAAYAEQRRQTLIKIDDLESENMCRTEKYARIRFLREIEGCSNTISPIPMGMPRSEQKSSLQPISEVLRQL